MTALPPIVMITLVYWWAVPTLPTAKIVGWTDPLDYGPVEELQKTLSVGAYAK